ncbi:MAG: hypothetical protein Q9195_003996 [Heterodermia aff. obscurata]
MSQFASRIPIQPIADAYDWALLGESTVVDVGGGHGPISTGLAKLFPQLRFIVQDLPEVIESRPPDDDDLRDRVSFMAYDFLADNQPVSGQAVYFFRAVFHNWPDASCVRILRNQVPALRAGAVLIVNETLLHEPGSLPPEQERLRRAMDISMLTYFGSRERNEADWRAMLEEADPRFQLSGVRPASANGNKLVLIEWRGQES